MREKSASQHVLVVTEHFQIGGLETHIATQIRRWHAQGRVVFVATQPGFDRSLHALVPDDRVLRVPLHPSLSAEAWLESAAALERFIASANIDVVHAHPFVSLFAAFLSAHATARPLIVSVHGPTLFEPAYGPAFELILGHLVLPHASRILCVSPETAALTGLYAADASIVVAPNAVPAEQFPVVEHIADPREKWLLVSRLDSAKAVGIRAFLRAAKDLGIRQVDVVGDGEAKAELETHAGTHARGVRCRFLGIRKDVHAWVESERYSGVAGMGRVILEAASMNLPSFLVGYDGVKGLVDRSVFERASFSNFSGRGLASLEGPRLASAFSALEARPTDYALAEHIREHWTCPAEAAVDEAFLEPRFRAFARFDLLRALMRLEGGHEAPFFSSAKTYDRLLRLLLPDRALTDMLRSRDREIASLRLEIERQRFDLESVRHSLAQHVGSKSWRLTAPLREGLRMLRRGGSVGG